MGSPFALFDFFFFNIKFKTWQYRKVDFTSIYVFFFFKIFNRAAVKKKKKHISNSLFVLRIYLTCNLCSSQVSLLNSFSIVFYDFF